MAGRVKRYGGKFQRGFGAYLADSDLADVTIVGPNGTEHRAHMLLLSYHSEFFRLAFNADFKEKDERRVVLGFDDPAGVWPLMLEFFYTDEIQLSDDTVLPLLAMSRELMVKSIEEYCSDYAQNSLEPNNAIQYLNQAVQFNCESFRESCVALVAEGFPASFSKPTDGLPSEVMLEVLTHPHLVVQTEEQVLTFVENYVRRHELPGPTVRQLYEHVRFPFLTNERLAALAQEDAVPKDLLLAGMALRLHLLDHPERLAGLLAVAGAPPMQPGLPAASSKSQNSSGAMASRSSNGTNTPAATASAAAPAAGVLALLAGAAGAGGGGGELGPSPAGVLPRKTYICSIEYGLPGGSEYACVPLHEVWDELVPQLHVRVSGDVVEGDAQSILRSHDSDSSWFMVSGDAGSQQPVWIEVELPPNMRVVELSKFTFSHGMNFANHMFPYGISDSAWFQMKCLYTQVSEGEDEPFHTLATSESSASAAQFEYMVSVDGTGPGARVPPWRRLRISTAEDHAGGTVRLSVRKLRLYGRVEISLTRPGPPGAKDVLALWRRRKEAPAARAMGAGRKMAASVSGSAPPIPLSPTLTPQALHVL